MAGFLARYSGATRASYATDRRHYLSWCAEWGLEVFAARRGHVQLWARSMEERRLARATIGRRLSTVAGCFRFAVLDGAMKHSPAEYVRRPKIDTGSTTLGLDRMEQELSSPREQRAAPSTMLSCASSGCCGSPRHTTSTSRT